MQLDRRPGNFGHPDPRYPYYPWSPILQNPVHVRTPGCYGETLPQSYQDDWTPKPPIGCFVNQSHHGLDPRSPHGVISRQVSDSRASTSEACQGPLQAFRTDGCCLWGPVLICLGHPLAQDAVPDTRMPSGHDVVGANQWASEDDRDYIAGQARVEEIDNPVLWTAGASGDSSQPNCKYTHALNSDSRAFLFASRRSNLPLLLPRAEATVRYHPEAFCFYTCPSAVLIVSLHSIHWPSPSISLPLPFLSLLSSPSALHSYLTL